MSAGVIRNPRSHANRGSQAPSPGGALLAEPATPEALSQDLRDFAAQGVELVVIDGGDGTVREVLSALPGAYGGHTPLLAVLPNGKTNILALDLGARAGWSLEAALARAATPEARKTRPPLEVSWTGGGQPDLRGFVFGTGAFVRATRLSKAVHRMGAYHSASVALTLAGAMGGVLFGGQRDEWRRGGDLSLRMDGGAARDGARFLMMATTLKRLPFGLQPFGPPREGLKVLDVDAPPRRLALALPALLRGRDAPWLAASGYRRGRATDLVLSLDQEIIVDGEIYPGGQITIREGQPLSFVAP